VHLYGGERLVDVAFGHHREMFWAASMVEGQSAAGTDSPARTANYVSAAAEGAMAAAGHSRLTRRSGGRAEIRRVLQRLP